MTSPAPLEDGNLPAAKTRLGNAVSALVDPKPVSVDDKILWQDCYYEQLRDSLAADQAGQSHGVARSQPPVWIDASIVLHEIDTAVAAWEKRPEIVADEYPTILRLRSLELRGWRPGDVHSIDQISGNIESWVEQIKQLLSPPPSWSLPNPCPACNTSVVYRKDAAGDLVRKPALQIGPDGCTCQKCRHTWAPQYFSHLASVLGYPLPSGVLE